MYLFVVAVHIVLCLMLVGIILLQPGKGADPGSAFGGGISSSMFGPRGPANLLSRVTTVVAVLFMVTSVTLALYSNRRIMTGAGDVEDALEELERKDEERRQRGQEEPPAFPTLPAAPTEAPAEEVAPEAPAETPALDEA